VDRLHALMIGTEPDLTLVIDMDPRKALNRSLSRLGASDPLQEIRREAASAAAKLLARDQGPIQVDQDVNRAMEEVDAAEDRFETFGLEFQERVRAGFLALAKEFPARIGVVDGDRPEERVAEDVAQLVAARLEARP
jgi:dTMP kinase